MQNALTRATYNIADSDLQWMALPKEHLPQDFTDFEIVREGELTNDAMAELPLSGHTAEELRGFGRVTGFQREWVTTIEEPLLKDDADLAVATVVHLMDNPEAVSNWMTKVFLEEFKCHPAYEINSRLGVFSLGNRILRTFKTDFRKIIA